MYLPPLGPLHFIASRVVVLATGSIVVRCAPGPRPLVLRTCPEALDDDLHPQYDRSLVVLDRRVRRTTPLEQERFAATRRASFHAWLTAWRSATRYHWFGPSIHPLPVPQGGCRPLFGSFVFSGTGNPPAALISTNSATTSSATPFCACSSSLAKSRAGRQGSHRAAATRRCRRPAGPRPRRASARGTPRKGSPPSGSPAPATGVPCLLSNKGDYKARQAHSPR